MATAAAAPGRSVSVDRATGDPGLRPCAPEPALALAGLGQRIGLPLVRAAPDADHRAGVLAGAAAARPGHRTGPAGARDDRGLLEPDRPDTAQRLAAAAVRAQAPPGRPKAPDAPSGGS